MAHWIKKTLMLYKLLCSHQVTSDSLQPHEQQHTRLPCPSLSLSLLKLMSIELVMPSNHLILCHHFLLLPSIFPTSGSFLTSQLFASGGQSITASTSAWVLPMNIQGGFPLRLTGLISLNYRGLSRVLQHHCSKAPVLQRSAFFMVQLSHPYMTTGKMTALIIWTFVGKVMSLLSLVP